MFSILSNEAINIEMISTSEIKDLPVSSQEKVRRTRRPRPPPRALAWTKEDVGEEESESEKEREQRRSLTGWNAEMNADKESP